MANIYDVAGALQQPNIPAAIQQGVATARQNALGNIAVQQAQQQQADTQTIRGLAPSIIAGDPNAYAQAAALNPDQANAYQGAADQGLMRLRGAMQYLDSQPTPQAKEAAYQNAVKPYLDRIGAAQGKTAPATFAEAEPLMEAARAQIAGLPASVVNAGLTADQKNRAELYKWLPPDQQVEASRIWLGLDPRAKNPNYERVQVPDGNGGTILAFHNKQTNAIELPNYGALGGGGAGSPQLTTPGALPIQNDPTAPLIQEANRRVQQGENPDQVQAWLQGEVAKLAPHASAVNDVTTSAPTTPGPGSLGYAGPKSTALDQRIKVARSLGANDEQIKGMVLGASGMNNAAASELTPGALENASWDFLLNGKLPPIGRGGQGQAQITAIRNHAADLAEASGVSPTELATQAGRQKALQSSLTAFQKRSDAMAGQENSFLNNLDQAEKISDLVDRTRSPAINRFLQTGEFETGDKDVAALRAALIPVAADYAKIMSGATGAGGTPVSTMDEALSLIRADLSKGQFTTVAQVLRNDVHNQRLGALQQLHAIRDNMSRFGTGTEGGALPKQTPAEEMSTSRGTTPTPAQTTQGAQPDYSHLWGGQ